MKSALNLVRLSMLTVLISLSLPVQAQDTGQLVPITSETVHRLEPISMAGMGSFSSAAWSHGDERIAVASTAGLWMFDADNPGAEPIYNPLDWQAAKSVIFSPDDTRLAITHPNGEISLWNLETQAVENRFGVPDTFIRQIDFSPDGELLLSVHIRGETAEGSWVYLWDVETREPIHIVDDSLCNSGERCVLTGAAFQPMGTSVAVVVEGDYGDPVTLHLLDVNSGSIIQSTELSSIVTSVTPIEFTPDGSQVIVGGSTYVMVWDIASNDVVEASQVDDADTRDFGHGWGISTVATSPDGRYFASGGAVDGSIQIYDAAKIQEILYFKNWRNIQSLAFSPDGSRLASIDLTNTFIIWDTGSGEELFRLNPGRTPGQLAFLDNQTIMTSATDMYLFDNSIRFWDAMTGEVSRVIDGGHDVYLEMDSGVRFAMAPNQGQFAYIVNNQVIVVDTGSRQETILFESFIGVFNRLAFSSDSQILVLNTGEHVHIWDMKTGEEIGSSDPLGMSFPAPSLAIDRSVNYVAWQTQDGIGTFDTVTHQLREFDLNIADVSVYSALIGFADDGRLLVYSDDNESIIFDVANQDGILTADASCDFNVSPNEMYIVLCGSVVGHSSNRILWDAANREEVVVWRDALENATWVTFYPNGDEIVVSDKDQSVSVWDLSTVEKHFDLELPEASIASSTIAFSPDASLIVGSDTAGNLLIWDAHDGTLLTQQQAHTSNIHRFAFNHDGTILATTGNNVVMTWGIPELQD